MALLTAGPLFRLIALAIALAITLLASQAPAFAHANLVETSPAQRAVLPSAPEVVILRFNETISALAFSFVTTDGSVLKPASVEAMDREVRVQPPRNLPFGTSLMNYRVVSADGHPVSGVLTFSIGAQQGEFKSSVTKDDSFVRQLIWLMLWVFYTGVLGGLGGLYCRHWLCAPSPELSKSDYLTISLLVLGTLSCVLSIGLSGADALGLGLDAFIRSASWQEPWQTGWQLSSYNTFVIAGIALVLALILALQQSLLTSQTGKRLASFFCLVLGCYALTLSGHASTAPPQALTRLMVFLHALGLALWVGALPILYEHYRYADGRGHLVLTRFSNLALPIVGIALSAGLVISWIQLGEVASLWTTAYGRILLVKLTIVSIILALAALNRWLLTPRLTQNDMGAARALRRTILGESIGVLLVMALVSGWRFTPPPRALLVDQREPIHVHIHSDAAMASVASRRDEKGR